MTDQTAQAARVLYGHGIKTVSGWRPGSGELISTVVSVPPTPENTTGRPQDGRGEVARGEGTPAGRTGAYEADTTIDENENEEN